MSDEVKGRHGPGDQDRRGTDQGSPWRDGARDGRACAERAA